MLLRTLSTLSSHINPEGMSIDTTCAGELLINFTNEAKPPVSGLLSPVPKSPSMTKVSGVSWGGSNCDFTSTSGAPIVSRRDLLRSQSALSESLGLMRKVSTTYPASIISLAKAKASPPLFPGPAKIIRRTDVSHRDTISVFKACAARSINWADVMFSWRTVNASSSCIC